MKTFFFIVGIIACAVVVGVIVFTTFFGDIHIDIAIKENDKQGDQ